MRAVRAAPRPLPPELAAHLAAHPGKEFTPSEIVKVLNRSSGAVAHARTGPSADDRPNRSPK